MGSQWAGMAKDLMKFQVFEQTIRKAADILKKEGFDLYAVFRSDDESTYDNVLNSFVSITVMQVSFFGLGSCWLKSHFSIFAWYCRWH